jgi:hypothetical protein
VARGGRGQQGALKVLKVDSERVVLLFAIAVTLDQTLGSWYHFTKPIHRFKSVLTAK